MPSAILDLILSLLHWGIGAMLALAFVCFFWQFFLPSWQVGRELDEACRRLAQIKAEGPVLDLDRVAAEAMPGEALKHCWEEYRDTLHGQKQANTMGMLEVARWRATAMANGFITEQSLVDARLHTEFYKHLPGILTGLGIIGTFSGLILGLHGFKVTDDAQVARESLDKLIQSVGGAFIVSGVAIALAMLVTTVEKFMLNRRYMQVERLCGLIDSLFDAGAGEEYLQRLVDASETAATQAMQMKESLVTDLKQVLTELTHQQIATITATSGQLGQQIASSLSEGLKEPLERISDAVQTVGGNQGDAVNRLLTDVLSGFSAQMESMFGSQMRGMNEMLMQTANTIQTASHRFEQLAGRIEQAGSGAADAMARRIEDLMTTMSARQEEANAQTTAFIEGIRQSVSQGQSESAELTRQMMKDLSESTGALVQRLQAQTQAAEEGHNARQAVLTEQTGNLLKAHGERVDDLAEAIDEAADTMRDVVDRLQTATSQNVERMSTGAERLFGASDRLSGNLDAMRQASDGLSDTAGKLLDSTGTLTAALAATQQALGEQRSVRDALAGMVTDLRSTVENARREASMTKELVGGLQAASDRLGQAQRAADTYLNNVTEVLAEAHAAFATQVESTLRAGNAQFHKELAQAVNVLKGAIQDLGDVFDSLPTAA